MTLEELVKTHGKDAATDLINDITGNMLELAHNQLPDDDYPNFQDEGVQEDVEAAMSYWEKELISCINNYLDNVVSDLEWNGGGEGEPYDPHMFGYR